MIEEIKNPYGYYELEHYQTKEGMEEEHINCVYNQWKEEDDYKARLGVYTQIQMRMRKIKNILKNI